VTTEDVLAVVRAMIRALADSGVRLTADEIAATQRALAHNALPLLDRDSRAQLASSEGWDPLVRDGRAILLDGGRYWTGDDHADGG
jgi:hypothetical protein